MQLAQPTAGLPSYALWGVRVMALSLNCLNAYWFSQVGGRARWGRRPGREGGPIEGGRAGIAELTRPSPAAQMVVIAVKGGKPKQKAV